MDKILEFILKNVKTNLKEVLLIVGAILVVFFYKENKEFFEKAIQKSDMDVIFYRNRSDSIQQEFNNLQNEVIKDKEEQLKSLKNDNRLLDKLLSDDN